MTAYMRIAVVILAGAALFGCATTAENAKSKPAVTAAAQDPTCLTDTGSRIAGTSKCRGLWPFVFKHRYRPDRSNLRGRCAGAFGPFDHGAS